MYFCIVIFRVHCGTAVKINAKDNNASKWPSKICRKIDLYFRDAKHAQIADLEIEFKKSEVFFLI